MVASPSETHPLLLLPVHSGTIGSGAQKVLFGGCPGVVRKLQHATLHTHALRKRLGDWVQSSSLYGLKYSLRGGDGAIKEFSGCPEARTSCFQCQGTRF